MQTQRHAENYLTCPTNSRSRWLLPRLTNYSPPLGPIRCGLVAVHAHMVCMCVSA